MTGWRVVLRSLTYHWRTNLAVALGVAAATAVLTGALLVGDSVRDSLRRLTLDRLGRIDVVLVSDRFFRQSLVEDLANNDRFAEFFAAATPAILFPHGTLERVGDHPTRAANVQVIGCDADFWDLGLPTVKPTALPGGREIVLNQPLAEDLGVSVGDQVTVRLPESNQVPADSPLADKSDRIRSLARLKVVDIVPAKSLGRFSLRASQSLPRCAFLSSETIQQALDQDGAINAVLIAGNAPAVSEDATVSRQANQTLTQILSPSFDDYGFVLKHVRQTAEDERVVFDYYSLSTDRMIFAQEAVREIDRAYAAYRAQPVMTYLANGIKKATPEAGDTDAPEIPYSMVAALDISADFQLQDLEGQDIAPLGPGEIILNQWAAEDLAAQPGDQVRVRYFLPETTHGQAVEQTAEFTVKAVTPLTTPAKPFNRKRPAVYEDPPTLANDPDLTPEVEGVTDQDTIDDWDPPFPFDYGKVRKQDETYWTNHRTTPKAFVSLSEGQRLWSSRFGEVTSYRIPVTDEVEGDELRQRLVSQLARDGSLLNFEFLPIKRKQLEASQGTTPFDGLFLALSFFVIAAALMLVALLFRLGVDQRAAQLGTLLAVGLPRRQAASFLVLEGAIVSALGGILGTVVGIGYAKLMLSGLRTWWVGAITTPFLEYHATPTSLAVGYFSGVLVCLLTIWWSVFRTRKIPVCRLLSGYTTDAASTLYRAHHLMNLAALVLALIAVGLLGAASRLSSMAQAGAFVGGGASLLAGLLLFILSWLKRGGVQNAARTLSLRRLALRNAARNPDRSAATIGLMATACFLIVAMSSFRLAPTDRGTGGFDLVAESSQPIFANLNLPAEREALLADQAAVLDQSRVFGLRLRPGDDASCNNLYRASQPRVMGVTPDFIEHFDPPDTPSFAWASTAAVTDLERANPWQLLSSPREAEDDAIPAIVDMNTAMYSLKPPVRVGSIYEATYEGDETVRFRIVALLENSILQGSLIVNEADFESRFPHINGYRFFLIQPPPENSQAVAEVLEDRLGDEGFDVTRSYRLLAQLLAVQNTYLSTFQSLGALGLLLGTFGLATVQTRNVLERRGELALLRAAGFRRLRLAQLVLWENVLLLVAGLATGILAALIAVLPHKFLGEASVPLTLLRDLAGMLAVVLVVGILASFASVRATLRAPLLAALREE